MQHRLSASRLWLIPILAASLPPARAQQEIPVHEKLIPTLWVQTAVEWEGLCRQAFQQARAALDFALKKNKKHSAALEQPTGSFKKKKPAVILDIDETVLDNSPGQARQVLANAGFVPKDWAVWVNEAQAKAIPGAAEFCRYAASRGVTVFFVTNRDTSEEAATRRNLEHAGFPLDARIDTVLTRGEKPEWASSDKSARRTIVASTHRIVLLVGDDLGDFLSGVRTTPAERRKLTTSHAERWGRDWIVLPNPGYGSWEEALYDQPRPADAATRLQQKQRYLDAAASR
ncbi:MAG: 5'-nucleotidase, lipoprotein e(P4) family [Bryobacterales bacterium]|nr:5'-nucleotidase, lipoprotein e(P4) family [Bryobacterales bacterium]